MDIYELVLLGKIEIDEPLEEDVEYSLALKRISRDENATVVKKKNNQDGYTYTFKARNLDTATLISGDKIIHGKPKKGSQSQLYRMRIWDLYDQQFAGSKEYKDRDDFYQKIMDKKIKELENKLI